MNDDQFLRMQTSRVYRFCNRVSQLVLVNLCVVLLSLTGLVVFGLYPAMFAAAAFFNEELEQRSPKMWPALWKYYKEYFVIGNLLMLLTVPTVFIGIYCIFGKELNMIAYLLLLTIIILVMVLNVYLPSVTVLYPKFSMGKKFLFSLVAASNKWKTTMLLMVTFVGWLYAIALMPQFCMFIFFSVMPWFHIWQIKKALQPDTIVDPTAPIPEDFAIKEQEEEK